MKPYKANLMNGIVLIVLGLWSYLGSETPSFTALIPVFAGALFLALTPAMKKENKVVAHVVVLLTFLLILAFYMPLSAALGRNDTLAIIRVIIMMLSSAIALSAFIKSFIEARRRRP